MKRQLSIILGLILSISGYAYDFEANGFYYNITSLQDLTVELTSGDKLYSGDVVIPEKVEYQNRTFKVTRLGDNVFLGCFELYSVEIPRTVATTGAYTFSGCYNLKTLKIPYSITEIGLSSACSDYGRYCFRGCNSLENLIFEEGSEQTLYLHPNSWTVGSSRTFSSCNIKSIHFGRNIDCFHRDYDASSNPFYNQSMLKRVTFGKDFTTIISRMFQGCSSLENIEIPSNITNIEHNAFLDCSMLSDVKFNEGLKYIGQDAFKNCKSIKKIVLPSSLTEIRNEAFLNCNGITQVYAKSSTPCDLYENAFPGIVYLSATLYVPVGAKSLYENAKGWKDFTSIVETNDFNNDTNYFNANISVSKGGKIECNNINVSNESNVITIKEGEELRIKIVPDEGYYLSTFTINGEDAKDKVIGEIYTINKVNADINIAATFEEIPISLNIQHAENGSLKLFVKKGDSFKFGITPAEGWKINTLMFNDKDVTNDITSDNEYTTPVLSESSILSVTFESTQSDVNSVRAQNIKVYASNGQIIVRGADIGKSIIAYDEGGTVIDQTVTNGYEERLEPKQKGIYIVKVDGISYKIFLNK